ncbi:hypothetical protein HNV12_27055 [Methanococcoides sp. SA1]|nr:hypothetical protein [Methanococcoides sp. SA1]
MSELDAISTEAPECMGCKHFIESIGMPACKAFPYGIPSEIWHGFKKHHESYEGDHGLQFEAISQVITD